ncbi:hypothetical protein AB835_00475 [Candidatus Endobugula sertula]|uniref:Uncharacterized protein n=1 Tax=Candidatus Endobugula sertula TaxID=62101 RepID=A0A1D2QTU7_9GAMM|nr:hypothetical protein AB835_00475 [Candidatus Endobugula sertula]
MYNKNSVNKASYEEGRLLIPNKRRAMQSDIFLGVTEGEVEITLTSLRGHSQLSPQAMTCAIDKELIHYNVASIKMIWTSVK